DVARAEAGDEPREAGGDHQRAEVVVGPPRPGEQARPDEAPADHQADRDEGPAQLLVVAREDEGGVDDAEREPGRRQSPERPAERCQRSASSAAPESSPFGMNPRTSQRSRTGPRSARSRLDVRTIAGPPSEPFAVSLEATSMPSMPGSWTSRSTTSGWSLRTASSADSPSSASPITSKPSASSSMRAPARKLG